MFKRGIDPATSLEIGKFSYLKEWFENLNFSMDADKITRKLTDILQEEDNRGWSRNMSHICKFKNKDCITTSLDRDGFFVPLIIFRDGEILIKDSEYDIHINAGGLTTNPSDIIKNIIEARKLIKKRIREREIRQFNELYEEEINFMTWDYWMIKSLDS